MARSNGVETRTRILDTAVELFAERGTRGTGMRELAEASDLTLPGLYYHFKSKQALVQAIFEERGAKLRNPSKANVGVTVAERVRRQAAADFQEMKDDFMRLLVLEAIAGDSDAAAVLGEVRQGWDARWARTLAGASDLVAGADVSVAARCVTTGLLGTYLLYLCGDGAAIDELADVVSDVLTTARDGGRSVQEVALTHSSRTPMPSG